MRISFCLFIALFGQTVLFGAQYRELIILLDSRGGRETIETPSSRYLMNKLQSALEEQEAPLLISSSLWENFLEKRLSISQMSKIESSQEAKTLATYSAINKQLNSSFKEFLEKGFDPIQSKQWMLDSVNQKFYVGDDRYLITHEMNVILMSYLTRFDAREWNGYFHPDHSLLLLIPKKYETKKKKLGFKYSKKSLGFCLEHLEPVENLEDPSYYYLQNPREFISADTLSDFFIQEKSLYSWNIYLSGHGGSFYEENPLPQAHTLIADLPIVEFQKFLDFCDKQISTKTLVYATCYGSGNHSYLAFGDTRYSYAIISDCLGDSVSCTFFETLPLPNRDEDLLLSDHLLYDSKTGWSIALNYHYQWGCFFTDLRNHSFLKDPLCWVEKTFKKVKPTFLFTTPMIRLPNAVAFTTLLADSYLLISDTLLKWKQESKSIESTQDTDVVLLEAPFISLPLHLRQSYRVPSIISIRPGSSKHFIQELNLSTNRGLLSAFWPLESDHFEREFLIEELSFPSEGFSLGEELGIKTDTVILKNIWVIAKESGMRIFLQTEEEKSFMLLVNKKELFSERSPGIIKGIHSLSDKSTQLYLEKYQTRKEDLKKRI